MTVVSIDGVVVPPERAVVSVLDRGFLYGDGVFEVLRTYDGAPFALGEHLARLARSAARVYMPLPVGVDTMAREVLTALAAAPDGESYVRIMVTRGVAPLGLDTSLATAPTRIVLVEPLRAPARAAYEGGVRVITRRAERPLAEAKSLGYLASIVFLHEARVRGAAEALLVDGRGMVQEGATSNLFAVRGGELLTPPEGSILAGITRAHVLAAAREACIVTRVADLPLVTLHAADEAFVTSSIRELVPVVAVDDRPIGTGAPGPLTRALHRAFRARACDATGGQGESRATAAMPWE